MLIEFICLFTVLIIFVFNYIFSKDILHPSCILSLVYFINFLFYIFMKIYTNSMYKFNINFIYFPIGVLVFSIASYIGSRFKTFDISCLKEKELINTKNVYKFFIIFQLIVLVLFLYDIFTNSRVNSPSLFNYIMATRRYLYDEKYIFQIFRTISFALSYIAIYRLFSKNKESFICSIIQVIISLIYMIFMTTRTVWFTFLIPCIFLILLTRYKDRKTLLKYGIILFIVFFILILTVTLMRGQKGSLEDIRLYLCSGMIQFSEWMKNQGERLNGQYTFRILFAILKKLKLYSKEVIWIDQAYLKIPNLDWSIGNVYTFYHGYSQDFGIYYALFIQFVVGVFHGFIYYMARKTKETFWVIIYAIFMYPLIMQFFSDQYASSVSLWLQMIIVAFITTKTNLFYRRNVEK